MALTPNSPESAGSGKASRPFKVAMIGIGISAAGAFAACQLGLSNRGVLSLLIGGMDFSAIAACFLALGPRYSLLDFFAAFIVVSIEIGLIVYFWHNALSIGAAPAFFLSLFFGIYGVFFAVGIARRISRKKSDILAETQESHEN